MRKNASLLSLIVLLSMAFAACNTGTNTNSANANSNSNMGKRTEGPPTPTATATPKYTEEQAREEREKAKANKETIGQSLEDAWIHTKIVTKLIGDTKTPERKINVDVVEAAVTLRGQVDTAEAKAEAERVAKETAGVKKVTNQLKVVAPSKPAKNANTSKGKPSN